MPNSIRISVNAAQAALDAVNHRIKIHEHALAVVGNEETKLGLKFLKIAKEVEQVLEDHKHEVHSIADAMADLKEARRALGWR